MPQIKIIVFLENSTMCKRWMGAIEKKKKLLLASLCGLPIKKKTLSKPSKTLNKPLCPFERVVRAERACERREALLSLSSLLLDNEAKRQPVQQDKITANMPKPKNSWLTHFSYH